MKRIVVLGMHRSGATAVARAIGALGATTGEPAHLTQTRENTAMRRINDALLEAAGGAWDAPPRGEDWLEGPAARELVERAERTLDSEFGTAAKSVWKDPRNALTLPFWLELFDEEPVVVLVHRHPGEVAASLRASDTLGLAHAYALWERYNASALRAATALPTIVLDYGQAMRFPAQAATFISRALDASGVTLPNDPATTDAQFAPELRHHVAKTPDRIDSPSATESQATLFALLDTVAGLHRPLALSQPLPAPSPVSTEILTMAATVRQLERERREARQGERKARRTVRRAAAAPPDPDGRKRDRRGRPAQTGTDATTRASPAPEHDTGPLTGPLTGPPTGPRTEPVTGLVAEPDST